MGFNTIFLGFDYLTQLADDCSIKLLYGKLSDVLAHTWRQLLTQG